MGYRNATIMTTILKGESGFLNFPFTSSQISFLLANEISSKIIKYIFIK